MKRTRFAAAAAAVIMTFALFAPAVAADETTTPEAYAADVLYQLGLFQGVGTDENGQPNFDLNRTPTRQEAVTMLVRLLGKDAEAKAGSYKIPFTDVADWAKPYVGYAYANKLTLGTGATTFGGADTVTPAQYLTFVLRALGYSSQEDFEWNAAWELSDALEITYGEYTAETKSFTRGNVAMISASALGGTMKNTGLTLLTFLKDAGALKKTDLVLMNFEVVSAKTNELDIAFFPIPGSPNTYTVFQVNSATINGQTAKLDQATNTKAAYAKNKELESLYPGAFNYTVISYQEEAALGAATQFYDSPWGQKFPLLLVTFDCTATLPDGRTVPETFTEAIYLDNYGQ
ncbi:MAG: hypothetical protein H6Q61_893 [Firmicutes bacterium]|nr:hypothetical protein [Bacillota bacterium]